MDQSEPSFVLPEWPVAYGGPTASAVIRSCPDDFIVNENLSFTPTGSGEHVFIRLEKVGENTEFVARLLARFAGVRQRDIGYAGLKDRHARTRQWFSIWLPGREAPDWRELEGESIKILTAQRHIRKLQRGALASNDFVLTLRDWCGDRERTEAILKTINNEGLPNYFGEQRFGREGRNIERALSMIKGVKVKRQQRSLYLSSLRSLLFNEVLAERIRQGNWQHYLDGDVLMFDRSRSFFQNKGQDPELQKRVAAFELHPAGPLFGIGESQVSAAAAAIENQVGERYPEAVAGLQQAKVENGRRPLRIRVENLIWRLEAADTLTLSFTLPPGSYATSLLREIIS